MILLRGATEADLPAMGALWLALWQRTMPQIDFALRLGWLEEHLRSGVEVVCAGEDGVLRGFATVQGAVLEQLAAVPGVGVVLLDEVKRRRPGGFRLVVNQDNARAIRFYTREGLVVVGEGVNPGSGLATWEMAWV